jgi:hypothetical protein
MKAFIAVLLIIAVAIAGYFGYRALSKPKAAEQPSAEAQTQPDAAPTPAPVAATQTKAAVAIAPATTAAVRPDSASTQPEPPKPKLSGEWKAKMDAILNSSLSPETKLQQMKEMLSKLSEADAEEAVHALASNVKNESFSFLKPLVVDPTMPEAVRDEFMVDLMNRPNSIKIPLFLEIARNPDHPDHESAFDTLEAFTGMKYGADWNGWEKGIEQWLKENPDRVRQPQGSVEQN